MRKQLLEVKNLEVSFQTYAGEVQAVRGVNFDLYKGETLAIVGESGSGKSVSTQAIMGLLNKKNTLIKNGEILYLGQDLLKFNEAEMQTIRGQEIATIFQDPMTSLNPTMTVGKQIAESIIQHQKTSKEEALEKAKELLQMVGVKNAENRMNHYPHQFSGGMRQRVMIAIALACKPKILIADEPTTALDVTIQAQILELMNDLKDKIDTSIIFITHDLGVVANMADRVAVMYAGKIVEWGTVDEVFYNPQHPYTWGLLASMPTLKSVNRSLYSIPGTPPNMLQPPAGDAFAERNAFALEIDFKEQPPVFPVSETHFAATWLLHPDAPSVTPPAEIVERHQYYQEIKKGEVVVHGRDKEKVAGSGQS